MKRKEQGEIHKKLMVNFNTDKKLRSINREKNYSLIIKKILSKFNYSILDFIKREQEIKLYTFYEKDPGYLRDIMKELKNIEQLKGYDIYSKKIKYYKNRIHAFFVFYSWKTIIYAKPKIY